MTAGLRPESDLAASRKIEAKAGARCGRCQGGHEPRGPAAPRRADPGKGTGVIARMHKAMKEKDEGFTLIELLVVIIIIGILAAIAIPVFLNQRKKGVDASMKSDLRTVANEEETNFTDTQAYAAAAAVTGPAAITIGADAVKLSSGNTVSVILNSVAGAAAY